MKWFFWLVGLGLMGLTLQAQVLSNSHQCVGDIHRLSEQQKETLINAYRYGAPHNLGYSLAAIAWQESCAGAYRVNFDDPSAGVFHTYIPGVFDRHPELKRNGFMENVIGEKLINDFYFAANEAILELKAWQKRSGNWKDLIKSYNKGTKWKRDTEANQKAERYFAKINQKVKTLKQFLKDYKNHGVFSTRPEVASLPIYSQKHIVDANSFKLLKD